MRCSTGWILGLLVTFPVAAQGDMPMPKPTAHHDRLDALAGDWDMTVKMWPMPGSEPMTGEVRNVVKRIHGGFWLASKCKGTFAGQPFEGMGFTGFDPKHGHYTGLWIDSQSTEFSTSTGEFDESGKVFTATGEMAGPEGTMHSRSVMKIGDDGWTEKVWVKPAEGDEFLSMEFTAVPHKEDKALPAAMAKGKDKMAMKSPACTDHHGHLAKMVGAWDAKVEMMMPGAPPMTSEATESCKMTCHGLWLSSKFHGNFGGMEFEGLSLTGYDPASGTYRNVWLDSMSPTWTITVGKPGEDGDMTKLVGKAPAMDGSMVSHVQSFAWTGDDERVFEMKSTTEEGEDAGGMKIRYVRKTDKK